MNITIRLKNEDVLKLIKIAGKQTTGAQLAASSYLAIREKTLNEVRTSLLTLNEAAFLIETLTFKEEPLPLAVLIADIDERYDYEAVEFYHKIRLDYLFQSFEDLTAAQLYFLQEEAIIFWKSNWKKSRTASKEGRLALAAKLTGSE